MSRRLDPVTALAHGPAARFATEVVEVRATSLVCRGRVPLHSPAVAGGEAGAWATLELAAQAAALLQATGLEAAGGAAGRAGGDREAAPVGGYLVRIRGARFDRPTVPAGVALTATVERTGGAGALSLFTARVELDGESIATAELATFAGP